MPDLTQWECRHTEKPVCLTDDDFVVMKALAPFGWCNDCKSWIHESALDFPNGVAPSLWPIEYIGVTCVECSADESPSASKPGKVSHNAKRP